MKDMEPLARYVLIGFGLFILGLLGAVVLAIAIKNDLSTALVFMGILGGVLFFAFSATRGLADFAHTMANPPGKRRKKQ